MKTTGRRAKPKNVVPAKRAAGRPRVDNPMQSVTLRFDLELLAELDVWIEDNGKIGRSAAVRMAIKQMVRKRSAEKSS